ncbi:hypothetical protein [Levilactobacillus spicheri]
MTPHAVTFTWNSHGHRRTPAEAGTILKLRKKRESPELGLEVPHW